MFFCTKLNLLGYLLFNSVVVAICHTKSPIHGEDNKIQYDLPLNMAGHQQ